MIRGTIAEQVVQSKTTLLAIGTVEASAGMESDIDGVVAIRSTSSRWSRSGDSRRCVCGLLAVIAAVMTAARGMLDEGRRTILGDVVVETQKGDSLFVD